MARKGKLKKAIKKAGKGVGKAAKGVGKAAKKVGKKLKHPFDVVKDLAKKGAGLPALLPFVPAMIVALKVKGVKNIPVGKPYQVAGLFYKNVIAPRKHFEHISGDDAFKAAEMLANNSGVPASGLVVKLIHAIVNYFKGIKKKKAGEPLTPEEKDVAGDEPLTPSEEAAIEEVDKAQDKLAEAGGGENSKGEVVPPPKKRRTLRELFQKWFRVGSTKRKKELIDWARGLKEGTAEKREALAQKFKKMTSAEIDTCHDFVFKYELGKNKEMPAEVRSRMEEINAKYKISDDGKDTKPAVKKPAVVSSGRLAAPGTKRA